MNYEHVPNGEPMGVYGGNGSGHAEAHNSYIYRGAASEAGRGGPEDGYEDEGVELLEYYWR